MKAVFSKSNPTEHPGAFCPECLEHAQHAEEVDVDLRGFWQGRHLRQRIQRSNKYPEGLSVYYICGRRT